jgi:hypothetical protein
MLDQYLTTTTTTILASQRAEKEIITNKVSNIIHGELISSAV